MRILDRPESTPIAPPPGVPRWPRTARGRKALRAAVAAVAGTAIGAVCAFVPDEARELCRAVARLASIVLGAG